MTQGGRRRKWAARLRAVRDRGTLVRLALEQDAHARDVRDGHLGLIDLAFDGSMRPLPEGDAREWLDGHEFEEIRAYVFRSFARVFVVVTPLPSGVWSLRLARGR